MINIVAISLLFYAFVITSKRHSLRTRSSIIRLEDNPDIDDRLILHGTTNDDDSDDYLFAYADDDVPFMDDDGIGNDNIDDDDRLTKGDDDMGAFSDFTDDFFTH